MNTLGKILKLIGATLLPIAIVGKILESFGYVLVVNEVELPLMDLKLALILAICGIVLWGIGTFLIKKYPLLETEKPKLDINDLSFIYEALKKTRNRALGIGILLGVFGLGMILLVFSSEGEKTGTAGLVVIWILAILCLLIAVFLLRNYYRLMDIRGSEAYRIITMDPQQVTELRVLIVQSRLGKTGQAINLTLVSGKKQITTLSVTEDQMELLKQYFEKYNSELIFDKKMQQT